MIPDASLAEMHALDSVQEAQSFDMRKQGTRRVLRGSPLCTTYVGSYRDKVTLAQIHPAPGDVWCIDCSLRRGAYLRSSLRPRLSNEGGKLFRVPCGSILQTQLIR